MSAGSKDLAQFGINQSYVLLGDGVFPVYGFAGYKNIDFGNFSTVNIFAQPIARWDYAGIALTAGVGYVYGLRLGDPANFFDNATIGAWDLNVQLYFKHLTVLAEFVESTPQTSSQGAIRSGLFYRAHDSVQVIRFDLTASF